MSVILALLSVTAVEDKALIQAAQARVDAIVRDCEAGQVVSLQAVSSNEIAILPKAGLPFTEQSDRSFRCVAKRINEITDLRFGFIGNEQVAEEKK